MIPPPSRASRREEKSIIDKQSQTEQAQNQEYELSRPLTGSSQRIMSAEARGMQTELRAPSNRPPTRSQLERSAQEQSLMHVGHYQDLPKLHQAEMSPPKYYHQSKPEIDDMFRSVDPLKYLEQCNQRRSQPILKYRYETTNQAYGSNLGRFGLRSLNRGRYY